MLTKVNGWTVETVRLLDGGVRCTVTPPDGTVGDLHRDILRRVPAFRPDAWRDLGIRHRADEDMDFWVVELQGFTIHECPSRQRAEDVLSRLSHYMSAEVEPLSLAQIEEAVVRAEVAMAAAEIDDFSEVALDTDAPRC